MSKAGIAWLVLIATPPTLILGGLVAMFVWQAFHGTITPKWRKPVSLPVTNAAGVSPDRPKSP